MLANAKPGYLSKRKRIYGTEEWKSILFILVPAAFLAVFLVYPVLSLVYHSFTEWGGAASEFVGLQNYKTMFSETQFWGMMRNNAVFTLAVPITMGIAIVVSSWFFERFPGWKFFRAVYFIPAVISTIVIGYLFRTMFRYGDGPVNMVLRAIGLDMLALDWLSVGWSARLTVIITMVWGGFGTACLIMMAGLLQYPVSIFESSVIDGANWIKRLIYIYIPLLKPTIEFYLVTSVIGTFGGMFSLIFPLTNGGPGYETTTLDYIIYLKTFNGINEFGAGCAIAVFLMAILLVFTYVYIRLSKADADWSGSS
jgi:multiple sugar transport system permease protein